jgi:hypothetical protein
MSDFNVIEQEDLNPNFGMKPPGDFVTQFIYMNKSEQDTVDSKELSPEDKEF